VRWKKNKSRISSDDRLTVASKGYGFYCCISKVIDVEILERTDDVEKMMWTHLLLLCTHFIGDNV
jgi:hypothetical protein